ncbi:MAG: TIGR00268 family protein, partial [Thaumarchaeota archaeon]|nr:TIGR00268 family protein [Nitrososphaerota archaeon]
MKLDSLNHWFSDKKSVLVALSGGVDSALVAYSAYQTLGDSALAVTADYKTLAQEELESAKKICQEIGINHLIISYDELQNPDFVKN